MDCDERKEKILSHTRFQKNFETSTGLVQIFRYTTVRASKLYFEYHRVSNPRIVFCLNRLWVYYYLYTYFSDANRVHLQCSDGVSQSPMLLLLSHDFIDVFTRHLTARQINFLRAGYIYTKTYTDYRNIRKSVLLPRVYILFFDTRSIVPS